MKYEITIRQLEDFTPEELKESRDNNRDKFFQSGIMYSDKPVHEVRVLHAEVSKEEFEAVKKAIIGVI